MYLKATDSKSRVAGASAPDAVRSRFSAWLPMVSLVLATLALYWPATHDEFVNYDDPAYVASNAHVQNGLTLESIKWAFLNPVSGNWHPLTMLSHMLDCQLFGLKPWGHHLNNVMLHALNAGLVFLLLRVLTGALWRSFLVAALFAVHPLRVESVAWVSERKDVLSAFFGLLALIFYARYACARGTAERPMPAEPNAAARDSRGSMLNYVLAFCCFAAGLLSKPMLVTWPCVMLLLDYWPLGRFHAGTVGRLLREKIPFFALAVVAGTVTFVVQRKGGAVESSEILPLGARSGNALISYCRYLGKTFSPTDLAYFYPHPGYWPLEQVLLACLLVAGISGLIWVQRGRQPYLLMGWLWFLGTLMPVIGLVQVGLQAMADRYTYIPSVGLFILVVWGACELTQRRRYFEVSLAVAGATVIILCVGLTRLQLKHWQDSESLFRHATAVTKNNYIALNNLGVILCQKGRTEEAIGQFQTALRLKPNHADSHYNLALALALKGQMDEAIVQYEADLRLKPDDASALFNLGIALEEKGRINDAIDQYRASLRLEPNNPGACNNLGLLLAERGQNLDQASGLIQKAVELDPRNAAFLDSLGWLLLKESRPREALYYQLRAVENSGAPDAGLYDHLGDIYAMLKQSELAGEAWRKALSLGPNPQIQKKLDDISPH